MFLLTHSKLEGASRPHFFRGVATVVTKLFNIIQPDRAYLGQKDIQQTIVLKALVRDLHIPVHLRVCPIVREPDGLALSSRNAYLDPGQRSEALVLWKALKAASDYHLANPDATPPKVLDIATANIESNIDHFHGRVSLDYLNIIHPDTLRNLGDNDSTKGAVFVGAIKLTGTNRTIRLIDNIILD
jgi:pantoate--beta-alanine ligase